MLYAQSTGTKKKARGGGGGGGEKGSVIMAWERSVAM